MLEVPAFEIRSCARDPVSDIQPDDDSDDDSEDDSEDEDVWDKTKESFSEYERRVNTPRLGDQVQRWVLFDFQPKVSASMAASGA